MAALDWEDLDAFLDVDEFATSASFQLAGGSTRAVRVIFDDPYLNAQLGEYELDTTAPRASGKAADLVGIARGDTATIDGKEWDVLGPPQDDGSGWAMLPLAPRS